MTENYEYCITVPRAVVHDCLNLCFWKKGLSQFFLRLLGILNTRRRNHCLLMLYLEVIRITTESFVNDLAQVPWYENALIDDAGEKVQHFNEKVLERHAPVRKSKVRNRQCPFLDQEIKYTELLVRQALLRTGSITVGVVMRLREGYVMLRGSMFKRR